jgi:hypothetical protein
MYNPYISHPTAMSDKMKLSPYSNDYKGSLLNLCARETVFLLALEHASKVPKISKFTLDLLR